MKFLTDEATLFFLRRPETLPLWEAMAPWLETNFPDAEMTVQKTQISFRRRIGFLFLSLPAKKYFPPNTSCIQVSFGLFRPLDTPRLLASARISARRYTHHLLIRSQGELDGELLALLTEAYGLAK